MLIKYGAIKIGERVFKVSGEFAGIRTYWLLNDDIYLSEFHTNDIEYTGDTGTKRLGSIDKLKKQYNHKMCDVEVYEILQEFNLLEMDKQLRLNLKRS